MSYWGRTQSKAQRPSPEPVNGEEKHDRDDDMVTNTVFHEADEESVRRFLARFRSSDDGKSRTDEWKEPAKAQTAKGAPTKPRFASLITPNAANAPTTNEKHSFDKPWVKTASKPSHSAEAKGPRAVHPHRKTPKRSRKTRKSKHPLHAARGHFISPTRPPMEPDEWTRGKSDTYMSTVTGRPPFRYGYGSTYSSERLFSKPNRATALPRKRGDKVPPLNGISRVHRGSRFPKGRSTFVPKVSPTFEANMKDFFARTRLRWAKPETTTPIHSSPTPVAEPNGSPPTMTKWPNDQAVSVQHIAYE